MNDCTEALVKIKLAVGWIMNTTRSLPSSLSTITIHSLSHPDGNHSTPSQFRPGVVDLPEGEDEASANAINVANFNEFDMQVR